jgi:hypothetical protein
MASREKQRRIMSQTWTKSATALAAIRDHMGADLETICIRGINPGGRNEPLGDQLQIWATPNAKSGPEAIGALRTVEAHRGLFQKIWDQMFLVVGPGLDYIIFSPIGGDVFGPHLEFRVQNGKGTTYYPPRS